MEKTAWLFEVMERYQFEGFEVVINERGAAKSYPQC